MSKEIQFEQSSIPSQYGINLKDNFGMLWADHRTADMYRVLLSAIADTLKFNQSTGVNRIGMIIKDDKGHFKLGAILTFKKPEEGSEEDSGNWYLELTFNPQDMADIDIELDNHSDVFVRSGAYEAMNISNGRFASVEIMNNMFIAAIDTLVQFLDTVATENEEVELILTSIFTASVCIENGEKIMSIVPGEVIKQIIKNDSAL